MAETPRRMTTRTKNSNQHPGQVVTAGTRKRRTKAQIAADNAEIAAKEAAELEALKGVIQRVADLERSISREEENESTPRPRVAPKLATKGLSRTRSYAVLPQVAGKSDCDMDEDVTESEAEDVIESEDVYRPKSASDAASESQTDNAHDTDSTDAAEGLPPKKRQKKGKTTFRAEIKSINEVARMSGVVQGESVSGDKATTTAGLPSKDITTCVLRHSYPGWLTVYSQLLADPGSVDSERKQETCWPRYEMGKCEIRSSPSLRLPGQGKRPTHQWPHFYRPHHPASVSIFKHCSCLDSLVKRKSASGYRGRA